MMLDLFAFLLYFFPSMQLQFLCELAVVTSAFTAVPQRFTVSAGVKQMQELQLGKAAENL